MKTVEGWIPKILNNCFLLDLRFI